MTLFCFCDFRLGEYFQWSDLWALAGSALGAFLGFLAASQIYKKERKDKKEEERLLEMHLFESARLLIERAAVGGRNAEKTYNELLQKYEDTRYGLHKRTLSVNTSLTTLDRMNRVRLLQAYKFVLSNGKGVKYWRDTWYFCEGLAANTKFSEGGVLANQLDLAQCTERMAGYCRELYLLASYVGTDASNRPGGAPLAKAINEILGPVQNMGFVLVDVMHDRLIEPMGELFKDQMLTLSDAYPLADVYSKARSAYQRYGQIVDEMKENLKDYATGCGEMAGYGEELLARMKNDPK